MRAVIFDYGAGNLHSLAKALEGDGVSVEVEADPRRAVEGDVLVLPGVGAFGAAVARLAEGRDAMRDAILGGLPTIGICLGMQLLFDASDEGPGAGLGVIPGRVTRLVAERVPQIGWNDLRLVENEPLFVQAPLPIAYYANSFVCRPDDERTVIAWSSHEDDRFPAAVRFGRTIGVQFHPEKSSTAGVRFLHAFLRESAGTGAIR
ncbi:MAG: imidazole glycerol phosphate synthase subunit HisH [Polaromonas sp.]|nr:imidazole glycerol phosphate synthase subunit HisH [Gemmatimonadaceae bacterium]